MRRFRIREGAIMQDGSVPPLDRCRPWRDIALELSKEKNPKRVDELVLELSAALDEQVGTMPSAQDGEAELRRRAS